MWPQAHTLAAKSTKRPEKYRTWAALIVVLWTATMGSCSHNTSQGATSQTFPESMADRMANAVSCMQVKGLDAVLHDGGIVVKTKPPAGMPAQSIMQTCIHNAGADAQRPPLSDDEVRKVYDYWLKMAACVASLGYAPDPSPSWDTFLPAYRSGDVWDPWGNLPSGSFESVVAKCPQQVPGIQP